MIEVIDTRSQRVVARVKTLRAALRIVDRKDAAYGAAVHGYRRVIDPLSVPGVH